MKKHLFGLAIFVSVVVAAVFVYGLFDSRPIPLIPAVDYPSDPRAISGIDVKKKIAYQVSAAELDVKSGMFRARVDLEWNGKHTPPTPVLMNFYLMTANGGRTVSSTKTIALTDMLVDGNRASVTVSLDSVDATFAQQQNLYTFVEFSTESRSSSVPDELIAMARLTPVLLLHDGQSVRNEPVRLTR